MTNQNYDLKKSMNNLKSTYSDDFNFAIDKISIRVNKIFDKVKELHKTVQNQTDYINLIDHIPENNSDTNNNIKTLKLTRRLSSMVFSENEFNSIKDEINYHKSKSKDFENLIENDSNIENFHDKDDLKSNDIKEDDLTKLLKSEID